MHHERAADGGRPGEQAADRSGAAPADRAADGGPGAEALGLGATRRARQLVGGELDGRDGHDAHPQQAGLRPVVAEGDRRRWNEGAHPAGQTEADRDAETAACPGVLARHRQHPRLPRMTAGSNELGGRPVGRVGFGAMQLPGRGVFGPPRDREQALAVLRRAIELGANHIDTAQYYGPDVANELIHTALHPYPEELVLVTKVGGERDAKGGWIAAQRAEDLRRGVEDNLRSLEIDRVDVVNLRRMDEHAAPGDAVVALADQLGELVALRDEGKIGAIGLSSVTVDQLDAALELTEIACVQNPMSLLAQDDQPTLDRCVAEGIAYVPFFPLGSAFPGARHVNDDPVVRAVADRLQATPAQVALAWLLAHSPNILLIPGTSSVGHLEQNMAAGELELDAEASAALAALAAPGPRSGGSGGSDGSGGD
jgi:pyridoxine 4-dehydrogenase